MALSSSDEMRKHRATKTQRRCVFAAVWLTFCCGALYVLGQTGTEHWVATWATAQQLMATPVGGRSGAPPSNLPATFANQTVRMIVRTSLGGSRVRVELSNM